MIDDRRFLALVEDHIAATVERGVAGRGLRSDLSVAVLDEVSLVCAPGGKRLRPVFVHLGWIAAGGEPSHPAAVSLGAAFELLHLAALVHDDVIDSAASRRGLPTTHVRLAGRHREAGWRGDPGRFGEAGAIILGDLVLALADSALASTGPAARAHFDAAKVEVNLGQWLDHAGAAAGDSSGSLVDDVMAMKTASYTVVRPLCAGATAADPGGGIVGVLGEYGRLVGTAFQLRDDVLGVFGDPRETGKPVGDDLREGKVTALVAATLARAREAAGPFVARIGAADLTGDEIAALQRLMRECGALEEVEERISRATLAAVSALDGLGSGNPAAPALADLAHTLAGRSR